MCVVLYIFFPDRTCVGGNIQLVNGNGVSSGRLEYCYNGALYSVCADSWEINGDEVITVCNIRNHYDYIDWGTIPLFLMHM